MSFDEIIDAVSVLPIEERIEISNIIQKQLNEERRSILASEILISNEELKSGNLIIQSVDEIMNDLTNEL